MRPGRSEAALLASLTKERILSEIRRTTTQIEVGHVYLEKSGRFYKIGRTNAVGRRERDLAVQLPEKPKFIHSIKTDDPAGAEKYWHRRFAHCRKNGEWFDLTARDVAAFKRWKLMRWEFR